MGDPVGIGPEIILAALINPLIYKICRPLVIGNMGRLKELRTYLKSNLNFNAVKRPDNGVYQCGCVDLVDSFELGPDKILWAQPTVLTGKAMISYIITATDMALEGEIDAIVTGP